MNEIDTLNQLLNSDLSNEETSMPVLAACLAELTIIKSLIEPSKDHQKSNWNLQFSTNAVLRSTTGKDVQPGFKGVFHTISLTPTEKYNPKQNLARFKEAVTGSKAGSIGDVTQYMGLKILAQLKPEASEQFGDRTVIARFVPRS